uniref:Alpha-lactalbumin n=1 Tax=Trichosurus vulpecula TaxID=9337 RepID=LALBA_TRIVU|nr:RecName: Full=Alpha-lactalbumin; AltName: Full=Lactose synthase B protein; Flags: Precursor [Trichosurus vulpecula]AAB97108.1 alpha-lactalbumin [Trichosurus vulpecula]
MMSLLPLLLIGIVLPATQAKDYGKCELNQILRERGVDKVISLPELICTMFHSSGFSTETEVDNNNHKEYGIFQISSNGWCAEKQEDVERSVCGILCSKLLDDDITDDIVCAKKILQLPERLDHWKAHNTFCRENLDQWNC